MTEVSAVLIRELGWDEDRGSRAMAWFIFTEAMLFVAFFFSYFLVGSTHPHWPTDTPPPVKPAIIMLIVLLASSGVLEIARKLAREGREGYARGCVAITILLGAVFLTMQGREYRDRARELLPTTDAYGSLFYVITGVHGLHVLLGLLMLLFVACLAKIGPGARRPPHRPLHVATMYWHFVDAAWVCIVAILYLLPHRGGV